MMQVEPMPSQESGGFRLLSRLAGWHFALARGPRTIRQKWQTEPPDGPDEALSERHDSEGDRHHLRPGQYRNRYWILVKTARFVCR